jgi:alpha-galactosidase
MKSFATLTDGVLTLSTGRIERVFDYNGGNPRSLSMTDLRNGAKWNFCGDHADCAFPGISADADAGDEKIDIFEVAASPVCAGYLAVRVECVIDTLRIRRIYRLYDDCPAIKSDMYLRGSAADPWRAAVLKDSDQRNIESPHQIVGVNITAPHIESLKFTPGHLRCQAVVFRDITDLRNNLVREESFIPYNSKNKYDGNLLLAVDVLTGNGLFMLKESPCSDVQQAPCGADFMVSRSEITAVGIGLDNSDLDESEWRRAYSVVVGVGQSEAGLLKSLRQYQMANRRFDPVRDDMVLVNTWGDRGQDSRIREEFVMEEIKHCARLGVSHLQLDDGWQKGQSSNSAFAGGSLENIWDGRDDYWMPHPERFPRGLSPVVEFARQNGIEIGIWFNPCKDDSYVNWEKDAQIIIGLYREFGIRIFKIDGVVMPDSRADRNLRAMFDMAVAETGGEARFNLDVTSGKRWGYHTGTEYGNLFVENRYTDWGNYYPHWTLRNLWQLSKYVPPQLLQIEFLNIKRNDGKYSAEDPLRPSVVPADYAFAVTMMAQPLGWFESQKMGDLIDELSPVITAYRKYQADIHSGIILPVGSEPDGTGWTGFQSIHEGYGYLVVYREYNQEPQHQFSLYELNGKFVEYECLLGQGDSFSGDGNPVIKLPRQFSFALYRYVIKIEGED